MAVRQNTPLEREAIFEGRNYYAYDKAEEAVTMVKGAIQAKADAPFQHLTLTLALHPELPQQVDEEFKKTYYDFFWRGYIGALADDQMFA